MIKKAWDGLVMWVKFYFFLHLATFILRRLIQRIKRGFNSKAPPQGGSDL